MKLRILLILLLTFNASSAMERDDLEQNTVSKKTVTQPMDLDPGEADSLDDCNARCTVMARCCWGTSAGWFKGINVLTAGAKLAITPLATFGNFSPEHRQAIGIAAVTLNVISLTAGKIYDFSVMHTLQQQKSLKQLEQSKQNLLNNINEIEKPLIAQAFRQTNLKMKSKSPHALTDSMSDSDDVLDPVDMISNQASTQLKMHYNLVAKQQQKLTDLTPYEEKYYKFAGCFWNSTVTAFVLLEFLSGSVESVLTGLATIPLEGASKTLSTITVVFVAITTLSIFMKVAAQAAAIERSKDFVNKIHEAGL